ncbi:MAG: hypothetical protein EB020_04830 [Proteobacteria bacterium]|nr:hypothetical protein [Pseudomonadota bacterium]
MEPVSIVEASGFLRPAVARHTLLVPAVVPAGVDRLDLRVTFEPSRVNGIRNLVRWRSSSQMASAVARPTDMSRHRL